MIDIAAHTFRSPMLIQLADQAIQFLNKTPVYLLPPPDMFYGTGVYMIYYQGNHPRYSHINKGEKPIYVGKAVPSGWRTGNTINMPESKLKSRLMEHSRSINSADNLNLSDFSCRFVIIQPEDSAVISVIESSLIKKLQPVWNTQIDGFGNHDPGKGRMQQARSEWDTLHPGRSWAKKLAENSLT